MSEPEKPVVVPSEIKVPEGTATLPVMEEYTLLSSETGPIEVTAQAGSPRELFEMLYLGKPGVEFAADSLGGKLVAFFTEATVRLFDKDGRPSIDIVKGWMDDEGEEEAPDEPEPDEDEEDEPPRGKRIPKFLRNNR